MIRTIDVLVVEDRELLQIMLTESLIDDGLSVTLAAEGTQAMSMLSQEGMDYRALIVDVNLPGSISGWDVARRARWLKPTMSVLYVTGYDATDWIAKGVPGSQILTKPFAMTTMLMMVSHLISVSPGSMLH